MDGMLNVFLGRKHNVYFSSMISSTTVTVIQMVAMLDGNNFREAFIILLLLNDVIPAYMCKYSLINYFAYINFFIIVVNKPNIKGLVASNLTY